MQKTKREIKEEVVKLLGDLIDEKIYLSDEIVNEEIGLVIDNSIWLIDWDLYDDEEDYDAITVDEMLFINKEFDKDIYYELDFSANKNLSSLDDGC